MLTFYFLGTLDVVDVDSSRSYRLSLLNTQGQFYISNNSLYVGSAKLDYEQTLSRPISLGIQAEYLSYKVQRTVDIIVADEPEPPCCLQMEPSLATVSVESKVGDVIATLVVEDEDVADKDFDYKFTVETNITGVMPFG